MARPRSPNYPSVTLGKAIETVRPVFKREHRNKMSRLVVAKHLGSNTLNGRVLARIGALRAYGLLDGPGDGLRVTDDAVVLLNAPDDSSERKAALDRCAFRPNIFKRLRDQSPNLNNPPSLENLRYSLVKEGFTENAAGKAAKSYLGTIALVSGNPSLYDSEESEEEESEGEMQQGEEQTGRRASNPPPSPSPPKPEIQRAEFPLAEGVARVEFPSGMSAESYQDLEEWLQLILRRAKRSVSPDFGR